MRARTTWTIPTAGQTQIALREPVALTFVDLGPTEHNTVILGGSAKPLIPTLRILAQLTSGLADKI
jgi:hypothetical protein